MMLVVHRGWKRPWWRPLGDRAAVLQLNPIPGRVGGRVRQRVVTLAGIQFPVLRFEVLMVQERAKVRIVKDDDPTYDMRSGVVTVTDQSGQTLFKAACDLCQRTVTRSRIPKEGQPLLCPVCQRIRDKAKSGTRPVFVRDKVVYKAPCDRCGRLDTVEFLPDKTRPFLCIRCLHQGHREDPKREHASDKRDPAAAHTVVCKRCGKPIQLRFRPEPGFQLLCPDCFSKGKDLNAAPERAASEHRTRVMYQLECTRCGRKETVDFVPKNPDAAICTRCFRKARQSDPRARKKRP